MQFGKLAINTTNWVKKHWKNFPLLAIWVVLCLPLPVIACIQLKILKIRQYPLMGVISSGATQDEIPTLSGNVLFSGVWQKQFSLWLNQKIPYRTRLIRLHNQIYFYLFHKSYMSDSYVIIGKNQYLYYMSFIFSYCNFNHQIYRQESFDQWAKQLETINRFFLRRGQKFIYVITPSKAAYYPQYLPNLIDCKNVRPDYVMARATLRKAYVPYVDGSEITLKNRSQYGDLLFSRASMHWTSLGAALTAKELAKKISVVTGHSLPQMKYSYTTNFNPHNWDIDLISLANLIHADQNFIVPKVSYIPDTRFGQRRRLKIAVIGGSFLAGVLDAFNQAELFDRMDYYFYFKAKHFYFVDGTFAKNGENGILLPFDPDDPHAYQNILDADVVILEENEILINSSTQLLADWLAKISSN